MFLRKTGALKLGVLKIYLKRSLFLNRLWRWRPATFLKFNPNTFTFKGICYRVITCSWDSKTFRSIYYPEIFSITDLDARHLNKYSNCFYISIRRTWSTYSRQKFSRLSWMIKRYYIQDYPEYSGNVTKG